MICFLVSKWRKVFGVSIMANMATTSILMTLDLIISRVMATSEARNVLDYSNRLTWLSLIRHSRCFGSLWRK